MADNRRAYGLAKKYGIDTAGMSPKEVWEALKEKGITSETEKNDTATKTERAVDKYSDDPECDKKAMRDSGQLSEGLSKPEKAYGFANKERKNTKHHIDHAKEMGYKNQDEYEKAAVDFFNSDRGKLYYSDKNDRFYRYDERQRLLVVSSNGVVHTFMIRTNKEFERKIKQDGLKWIK